jgi:hypothetical protein
MPPHKCWSLVDPRVCSRTVSIAEVERRHAATAAPRTADRPRGLARTACAQNPCRKLRLDGQVAAAVAATDTYRAVPGGGRWTSRWKTLWARNHVVLAHRGGMGPRFPTDRVASAARHRGRDRERQRCVRPARALPNKRARVLCTRNVVAVPPGGRNATQLAHTTHNRGATWGWLGWQQPTGVGDELPAFSACKRTRDGVVGWSAERPRASDEPGNCEIGGCSWQPVGCRDRRRASCSARRPGTFGCRAEPGRC